jgi:hypothetical protein
VTFSICVCLAALVWLLSVLRSRISFGLPLAYLFSLLLIHVPGAFAHIVSQNFLAGFEETELGIYFTAIGSVCFVGGVFLSKTVRVRYIRHEIGSTEFNKFCLFGGWLFVYGLTPLFGRIPSLAATIEKGGAIWILGVLLGLRGALKARNPISVGLWLTALSVYPTLMLLLGGFLSYGTTVIIIVASGIAISTKNCLRVVVGAAAITLLGLTVFVNYLEHRDQIRAAVWGGASMEERIDVVLRVAKNFESFDSTNALQMAALDVRLNQNYFAGMAAERIDQGLVPYLYGRSIWEGVLALVPRALWSDKPVFGGSGNIVRKMTGLDLDETTSWGVGQVMEFQINFGIPGIMVGFFLLGWLLGTLDRKAALAERNGDLRNTFLFFLPAVALIQPNGSIVELSGGVAAALVGAYCWRWIWDQWSRRRLHSQTFARRI